MVTIMHTADETVSHVRKKPRVNAVNKANLNRIWGDSFARMIEIPKVIDDYNHWMGGVDQNDQLIANYCHQLHCKRIWMPLMFHSLDVLHVNAYLAHFRLQTDMRDRLEQKEFVLSLVEIMQERAIVMNYRQLRSAHEHTTTPPPVRKRQRINAKKPSLPIERLEPPMEAHVHTFSKTRSTCKYCSYLKLKSKQLHPTQTSPKVSNVYQMCSKCNVHLCEAHFQLYHTKDYNSSDDEDEKSRILKNFKKLFTSVIASLLLIQLGSIRGVHKGILVPPLQPVHFCICWRDSAVLTSYLF